MYPVLGHLSIQQFLTLNTHWNWIQCINAADRTKKHDLKWLTYTVVITTDCMTIQDKAIVNTFKNQVWAGGHNTDEWTSTKSLHNFRNVGYNITHNHFGENTTIYCMMLHIEHSCKTFCCFFSLLHQHVEPAVWSNDVHIMHIKHYKNITLLRLALALNVASDCKSLT